MNIAIFTDIYLPHIDGVTNSLSQLVKGFVREGHQILVVTPKMGDNQQEELLGAQMYYMPSLPAMVYPETKLGLFSPRMVNVLRKFKPDLIHIATPAAVGFSGLMYSKIARKPAVGVFHGYFMEPEYLRMLGLTRVAKQMNKVLWRATAEFYNQCDHVLTPSKFVAKDLEEHGISTPISVIHNSLDLMEREEDQGSPFSDLIHKLQSKKRKCLLYVGRLSREKNLSRLLELFALVCKDRDDTDLLLVGGGPISDKLKLRAYELGINDRVHFAGKVAHKDLLNSNVYELADCFVTVSASEVQPMSIIEAMHFGLPLIAGKSRGVSEMVDENGFLISPDNEQEFTAAVYQLLNDTQLRKQMGKKSMELTNKYSLSKIITEHIELYQQLTAS